MRIGYAREPGLDLLVDADGRLHDELAKAPIDRLPLSKIARVRVLNCLHNMQARKYRNTEHWDAPTLGDVLHHSTHDLLRAKNFGRKSLYDLDAALASIGLRRCADDGFVTVTDDRRRRPILVANWPAAAELASAVSSNHAAAAPRDLDDLPADHTRHAGPLGCAVHPRRWQWARAEAFTATAARHLPRCAEPRGGP